MQMKIQLRKDWEIKPEVQQLEGKVFNFAKAWDITDEDSSIYAGEQAMMPIDPNYPVSAPTWIASGDLVPA